MIPADHAHLIIAAATHPGMRGKPNEDRYSVSAYRLDLADRTPSVLALLADGIGGHHAGEVAAELAVKNINKYIVDNYVNQPIQSLKHALTHANQIILNYSKKDPALSGMGTTCVCAWVIGDRLYAASVGDSRLYLQRGVKLIRLTTDHTWVQEALSQGTLTPDQIKGHPNAHVIRRFLGSMNAISPDIRLRLSPAESDVQAEANQGLRLVPGDRLVLCTDGLTDLVKDAEILDILRTNPLELSLTQMINLANQRGGHDNITVVILEVPQPAYNNRPQYSSSNLKNNSAPKVPRTAASWWMLALLLVAILMMILLLVYTYIY
jgi:serine/threonine protein phosphatase PrpC